MTVSPLLRGIDTAAFVTAFTVRLRVAGIDVGPTSAQAFARALEETRPDSLSHLYWAARITLVRRQIDLAVFDRVFAAVFDERADVLDAGARRNASAGAAPEASRSPVTSDSSAIGEGDGLPWATLPTVVDTSDEPASGVSIPERLPSRFAALADTPFEDFTESDLALLGEWLKSALQNWPSRRTRRHRVRPSGSRVAFRETIARSRRTGWEPVVVVKRRWVVKPRRLVMLCDVSQSMQAYTTVYLHLMRAAALAADSEVFAFSTSLTRLTPALRHKSPEVAIAQGTEQVADRFGGTRIATNIRAMLASHRGNAARGAIVIVASDGWDSDPPERLEAAMARLQRRAHRVIWLNPRAASSDFRPLVGAMAAALPHCDEFLPAHNVDALSDVLATITKHI